jgi:hypothetical protein
LGLLWQPQPRRIYAIGLGGGRVPLVLHHYLPGAAIECSEIDPVVLRLAERYFGLRPDERLHVAIEDGREWLAGRDRRQPYDIIFVDAFLDRGYAPYRLATVEFCELAQAHLSERGVLIINLRSEFALPSTVESVFLVNLCPVPARIASSLQPTPPWTGGGLERAGQRRRPRFTFPSSNARLAHVKAESGCPISTRAAVTDDAPPEAISGCCLPSTALYAPDPERLAPCPAGLGMSRPVGA